MKNFTKFSITAITMYFAMAFTSELLYSEPIEVVSRKLAPIIIEPEIEEIKIDIKGHDAFLSKLGNFESGNDYKKVNRYGYMGRYQFGEQALEQVDLDVTKKEFLNSPELQEIAMHRLMQYNDNTLSRFIRKYEGQMLHGVLVTRSGVLAAAHLGGATNVKRWFRSGKVFKDGNGTTITKYMKIFSGYSLDLE